MLDEIIIMYVWQAGRQAGTTTVCRHCLLYCLLLISIFLSFPSPPVSGKWTLKLAKELSNNIVEFYDEEIRKCLALRPLAQLLPEAVEPRRRHTICMSMCMWELPERLNRHKSSWQQLKAGEKNRQTGREKERERERWSEKIKLQSIQLPKSSMWHSGGSMIKNCIYFPIF